MKNKLKNLLHLFLVFLKIGSFNFGGGYTMLAFIRKECVEKRNWITENDMMTITAISESTPGPIFVKCATYIGYKMEGIFGAISASLGMLTTSFTLVFLISFVFDRAIENPIAQNMFSGITISVGFLIVSAGLPLIQNFKQKTAYYYMAFGFVSLLLVNFTSLNFPTVVIMLICGLVSLGLLLVKKGAK